MVFAGQLFPRLFPAEGLGALHQTLSESRGGVGGIARSCLAVRRNILEPQLHRIHPDGLCQSIHHLLKGPGPLGVARCAHGPGRPCVDVNIGRLGANVGAGVKIPDHPVDQGGSTGRISPTRPGAGEIECGQGPVFFHPRLQAHVTWRPVPCGQEGLLPGENELDRTGCEPGKDRGDDGVFARTEFAAEASSHVMAHHSNL